MIRLVRFVALVSVTLASSVALGDVPGPRDECDTQGLTCETCWEHYGASEDEKARFEQCAGPLREKGLTEGCRHRQGAGDQVFFCANGQKPKVVTVNRGGETGCGGCAVSTEGSGAAGLSLAALALACVRRRRPR